jgi:hypothetical protein
VAAEAAWNRAERKISIESCGQNLAVVDAVTQLPWVRNCCAVVVAVVVVVVDSWMMMMMMMMMMVVVIPAAEAARPQWPNRAIPSCDGDKRHHCNFRAASIGCTRISLERRSVARVSRVFVDAVAVPCWNTAVVVLLLGRLSAFCEEMVATVHVVVVVAVTMAVPMVDWVAKLS